MPPSYKLKAQCLDENGSGLEKQPSGDWHKQQGTCARVHNERGSYGGRSSPGTRSSQLAKVGIRRTRYRDDASRSGPHGFTISAPKSKGRLQMSKDAERCPVSAIDWPSMATSPFSQFNLSQNRSWVCMPQRSWQNTGHVHQYCLGRPGYVRTPDPLGLQNFHCTLPNSQAHKHTRAKYHPPLAAHSGPVGKAEGPGPSQEPRRDSLSSLHLSTDMWLPWLRQQSATCSPR
jgi:hypothetical protein